MRNIPAFTTEFGAASLILKEIPYSQTAYIKILSSQDPEQLLAECVSFCKAAGAEKIFAAGHTYLEKFPLHTEVICMEAKREALEGTAAEAVPVTQETLQQWRSLYNARMQDVDNAAFMTETDARQMLRRGDAYFVQKDGLTIGIAMASGGKIDALASSVPGAGRDCVLSLKKCLTDAYVSMDVASTNLRAVRLYERLGFVKKQTASVWYKII